MEITSEIYASYIKLIRFEIDWFISFIIIIINASVVIFPFHNWYCYYHCTVVIIIFNKISTMVQSKKLMYWKTQMFHCKLKLQHVRWLAAENYYSQWFVVFVMDFRKLHKKGKEMLHQLVSQINHCSNMKALHIRQRTLIL